MSDDFFAPPAFKPSEALQTLKRQLRDLRLAERGDGFELTGQSVVALSVTDGAIEARLVKRPQHTPEWTLHPIKSSADLRKFVDTVKQRMGSWSGSEE